MFYSQTFLARKGPLGTVWCAAHLQHRLKKSHYISTDIPSTVERIMFPEVPIALRMSSHLLLGVVRIYSKKVDYLFQDCTAALVELSKAFTNMEINLPENATAATFDSVTLPPNLNLDAFDTSDYIDPEGSLDNHLKRQEEITITNQISPYIAIPIDEEITMDAAFLDKDPDLQARPTDNIHTPTPVNRDLPPEDTGPRTQTVVVDGTEPGASNQTDVIMDTVHFQEPDASNQPEDLMDTGDFQDPGPSTLKQVLMDMADFCDPDSTKGTEKPSETLNENSPPEIEVIRDATYNLGLENFPPLSPGGRGDATELNNSLDKVQNEKDFLSPIMEDALPSLGQSLPFQQHSKAPTSAASQDIPDIFNMHGSFADASPQFTIHSTPPIQQPQPGPPPIQQPQPRPPPIQQPHPRQRKRRGFFDEATVLTNRFMKAALEDSSELLRVKRKRSTSALGVWKLNNKLRKEQIFYEPTITGYCAEISNLFKESISMKPHLTLEQGATSKHRVATPPPELEANPEPQLTSSPVPRTETILEPVVTKSPAPGPEFSMGNLHQLDLGHDGNNILPEFDMEIERPRDRGHDGNINEFDMGIEHLQDDGGYNGSDFLVEPLPSPARPVPSSLAGDDFTPKPISSLGSGTVPLEGTTTASRAMHSGDTSASPETFRFGAENSGLSDIPEMIYIAEDDDLGKILEADNAEVGSQGTRGVDSLSVRTRAVAKYLKEHSPIILSSERSSGDMSFNVILQSKTRRTCARMFFETLVLKSNGLVDVHQEEHYGDITLKLTPTLSKAQL